MDSKALCDFCNSINFGAAGFWGSDIDFRSLDLRGKQITLNKILQNPKQCLFCGKIADFFHDWRLQKFSEQTLDLEQSSAYVSPVFLRSLEIDVDLGKPEGHLVYIDVIFDVKMALPSAVLFRPILEFRKCSQNPLKVTDICDGGSLFTWEGGQDQLAYSGRIRPLVADTRLFCKWKETCCTIHGDHCNSIFKSGSRPRRLRLIDAEKRCVVDNEDRSRYVALSYVWGEWKLQIHSKEMPKLTKLTENGFKKPGSLTREKVLSTIDDAIELTLVLGEKYLWVDCLCILQKDGEDNIQQDNEAVEADQREFIPQMDSIYGFASVTIVAASGDNANAGLPGVRPNSRTREQVPFTIKGASFLQTLDPIKEFSAFNSSYLGDCVWNSRGWTFQENLFSGKALIFTPEQVYWECQKASWCEDGLWETDPRKSPTVYRHNLAGEEFRHPWRTDVESFDRMYGLLVQEYSARALSFERDGLDAFAGILHHLKREGKSFLGALPVSLLSLALTWWPVTSPGRRRTLLEDGTTTLCRFPSWSWVGWVGKIDYSVLVAFGSLNSETIGLIFYHLDDSGLHRTVQEAAGTQTCSDRSFIGPLLMTTITREDLPESVFSLSISPIILCFWSCAAILNVRHEVEPQQLTLSSYNGKIVPVDWFHMPLLNPVHEELFEFVVIESVNFNADGDCLALLLVSWVDSVAYRRGLVNIETSDWVELDNRVWKIICLG